MHYVQMVKKSMQNVRANVIGSSLLSETKKKKFNSLVSARQLYLILYQYKPSYNF